MDGFLHQLVDYYKEIRNGYGDLKGRTCVTFMESTPVWNISGVWRYNQTTPTAPSAAFDKVLAYSDTGYYLYLERAYLMVASGVCNNPRFGLTYQTNFMPLAEHANVAANVSATFDVHMMIAANDQITWHFEGCTVGAVLKYGAVGHLIRIN